MNNRSTPIFPSWCPRAARVLGVAAMLCWYDPRAGHLLLEILKPGQGAIMPPFDQGFDGVSYAYGIYDDPAAALVQHRVGIVAQFIYTAVPEPTVLALIVVGGLALLLGKGRK